MARTPEATDERLDLTKMIQTRISFEAKALLKKRAKVAGLRPSTWARQVIYRALGLLSNDKPGE